MLPRALHLYNKMEQPFLGVELDTHLYRNNIAHTTQHPQQPRIIKNMSHPTLPHLQQVQVPYQEYDQSVLSEVRYNQHQYHNPYYNQYGGYPNDQNQMSHIPQGPQHIQTQAQPQHLQAQLVPQPQLIQAQQPQVAPRQPIAPPNSGVTGKSRASLYSEKGLVQPIPPLHIQQQIVNDEPLSNPESDMLRLLCSRCKKVFDQPLIIPTTNNKDGPKYLAEPKIFKLCQHCRDLQRQRSRRWQKKTKDKQGACRRCGSDIPLEDQKFVLCPGCRQNLRKRKANRAAQGRCVHCSGPLDASIIDPSESSSTPGTRGNYKVCERCRENDKIRRTNLEKMGNCNRCAKSLDPMDIGKHKVCTNCRTRKKKLSQSLNTLTPYEAPELIPPQNAEGYQYQLQFAYNQAVAQAQQQAFNLAMAQAGVRQSYAAAMGVKVEEFPYQQ